MSSRRSEQRAPWAFTLAGALMLVGVAVLAVWSFTDGMVAGPLYVLALAGSAAIAVALGLLGLRQRLRDGMSRFAHVGAGVTVLLVAGGALVASALVVVWLVEPWFSPRTFRMDVVVGVVFIASLAMLAGLLLGLLVVGVAAWRAGLGGAVDGPLLVASGLLSLFPLSFALLPAGPARTAPGLVFVLTFGLWAAMLLVVGSTLRTDPGRRTATR